MKWDEGGCGPCGTCHLALRMVSVPGPRRVFLRLSEKWILLPVLATGQASSRGMPASMLGVIVRCGLLFKDLCPAVCLGRQPLSLHCSSRRYPIEALVCFHKKTIAFTPLVNYYPT
jgi:hypothetical protein